MTDTRINAGANRSPESPAGGASMPQGDQPGAEGGVVEVSEAAAEVIRQLTREREEALAARQRALADFRNYQRRADENEARALASGSARVVRSILPALDHLELSVAQNAKGMSVEKMLEAVRMVDAEFIKALASCGVERIEPVRGEEFTPGRHEAVMQERAADVKDANRVVSLLQAGYAMGDLVLRPAKVSVTAGG